MAFASLGHRVGVEGDDATLHDVVPMCAPQVNFCMFSNGLTQGGDVADVLMSGRSQIPAGCVMWDSLPEAFVAVLAYVLANDDALTAPRALLNLTATLDIWYITKTWSAGGRHVHRVSRCCRRR